MLESEPPNNKKSDFIFHLDENFFKALLQKKIAPCPFR